MKVKIGNTIYDAKDQPVMVIFSDLDKKNIANMLPECTKYACWPDDERSIQQMFHWMAKV